MNSVALPTKAARDDAAVSRFAQALTDLMGVWMRFPKWRDAEAQRLVTSMDWTPPDRIEVPLEEWLATFPTSLGASVDVFCRFTGTELPEHPSLRRLSVAQLDFLYEV